MAANKFYLSDAIENIKNKCSELKNIGIDVSFVSIIENKWEGARKTKVLIHCNKHNIDYEIRYEEFLRKGHKGCPECRGENISASLKKYKTEEEVVCAIKEKINNENLNLEFCGFVNNYSTLNKTQIEIACTEHGLVGHPTIDHFFRKGFMCPECIKLYNSTRKQLPEETLLNEINDTINSRLSLGYNLSFCGFYSKDGESPTAESKLIIKCCEHETLSYPTYHNFITGKSCGCPSCSGKSSTYERECRRVLKEKFPNLQIIEQYKIPHHSEYDVGPFNNENLYIDFYIPEKNLFIEYNGEQHYVQNSRFHSDIKEFEKQKNRDAYVKNYCKQKGISLLVISYIDKGRVEEIICTYIETGKDISIQL